MIVVAGGTGRLGSVVVRDLLDRGHQVRVLTRDPARAAQLVQAGATAVRGDVRDPDSLGPAVAGATVVLSAVQGFAGAGGVTPASVDRDGNAHLVGAARSAGADVVMMSVVGAAADHPMELFRMKAAAEQHLRDSGVPHTIVRATAFLELWEELLRKGGTRPLVFGRGENPINFVPVGDVAALVVQAVTDPTTRGRTLEVSGPQDLTFVQLAARVAPGARPRHVPRAVLRVMATVGPPQVRRQGAAALAMDTLPMAGRAAQRG